MKLVKVAPLDVEMLDDKAVLQFVSVDYVVGAKGSKHRTLASAVAAAIKAGGSRTIAIHAD